MLQLMGAVAFALLFLGCPIVVVLLVTFLITNIFFLPDLNSQVLVQRILAGITPAAVVCVPMFLLAANITTSGKASEKIINVSKAYFGHIRGGLPIVTNVACTLFGAVSGSTQATVAAIGKTVRPMLLSAGYSSSQTIALIINSSDIAYLIPPSIGFIIYGAATQTSVGRLFLAGIVPGLLICICFSIYAFLYASIFNMGTYPKASWETRKQTTKEVLPIFGFPIIIFGGIFGGIFSPTEAGAACVAYALVLEGLFYRTLTVKILVDAVLDTGVITAVVFAMVGAGSALAWILSYSGTSKVLLLPLLGEEPSVLRILVVMSASYFVACMFVSPIVAIYVLSSIFGPYITQAGIDKVFVGVLVCLQGAIGSATPPVGGDIWVAMMVFKRPYFEVIRGVWPYVIILLSIAALIISFPELVLFIPNHALGG